MSTRRSSWHSRRLVLSSLLLATAAATAAAQEPEHSSHTHAPSLGSVNFRNSGTKAAQAPLQRGVAWLHNFKYKEAAAAFREAERADKNLAVAYWLEALTYSHVLWGYENLAESRATLARLAPTPAARLAKARSLRERAFGAAVEAFYADASLAARTRAYADSMQSLAASDPTDLEAAAFASHGAMMAWMAAPPADRPALAASSRALALRVFNANPNHPGAAHYLTHVSDMDPQSAAQLLQFARAYDKIAPDADHALHMPSHVYLPLGLWSEVSSANERSWAAARAENTRDRESHADLSWHSLEWLQYAYLQEGRWDAARATIDTARSLLNGVESSPDNADAMFAVNVLAFVYGMDTGDWTAWPSGTVDVTALFAMPMSSQRAWGMTMTNIYQTAVAAIYTGGDRLATKAIANRFRAIADTVSTPAQANTLRRFADQIDALNARADGDLPRAVALLRSAAAREPASASTPPVAIPTHELLGQLLMEMNSPAEAATAFRAALVVRPNRSRALLGLARSLAQAGDSTGAKDAYSRLGVNWQRGDHRVTQLMKVE